MRYIHRKQFQGDLVSTIYPDNPRLESILASLNRNVSILWFAKETAPVALLQWMILLHDISFIATGAMLFVHVYLSAIHPLMRPLKTGPWNSMMTGGTVSAEYAKTHHGKWYEEVSKSGGK